MPKCFWSIRNPLKLLPSIIKLTFLPTLFAQSKKISESQNLNSKMFSFWLKTSIKSLTGSGIRKKGRECFWWKINLTFHRSESLMTIKWRKKTETNLKNFRKISSKKGPILNGYKIDLKSMSNLTLSSMINIPI